VWAERAVRGERTRTKQEIKKEQRDREIDKKGRNVKKREI
jgi:hypothetical protein